MTSTTSSGLDDIDTFEINEAWPLRAGADAVGRTRLAADQEQGGGHVVPRATIGERRRRPDDG